MQALSNLLNVNIYFKKITGIWRLYEPKINVENLQCDSTIYLQEFRSDSSKNTASNRYVRILLNKKLWLSRPQENTKICMKFSQFNDTDEFLKYEKYYFCLKPSKITEKFYQLVNMSLYQKIFFIFIHNLPIQSLMHIETSSLQKSSFTKQTHKEQLNAETLPIEMEFSTDYNTIGKQFLRFELKGKQYLIDYLNYLWGKRYFNDEFIHKKIRLYNLE
jgi:hypothetical protein